MKSQIAMLLALLMLAGCGMTKDMSEMHDTTKHMDDTTTDMDNTTKKMSDTTSNMSTTTNHMSGTTDHMASTTDGMAATTNGMAATTNTLLTKTNQLLQITHGLCNGSSQALPLQAREKTLDKLDQARTPKEKMSWAVTYAEGFDFQVWPLCQSTQEQVDNMLDDAVQELFQVLDRYNSGRDIPAILTPEWLRALQSDGDLDVKDLDFDVFAAALTYTNRHQRDYKVLNPSAPFYSFYSIIRDALLLEQKVKKGEVSIKSLKDYQIDIQQNHDMAVRLLQARQLMSMAIVLNFANDQAVTDVTSVFGRIGDRVFGQLTGGTEYIWHFNIDKWNEAQELRYTEFLQNAIDTRALLKQLGIKPAVNPNLRALVGGMTPVSKAKLGGAALAERKSFEATLKRLQQSL